MILRQIFLSVSFANLISLFCNLSDKFKTSFFLPIMGDTEKLITLPLSRKLTDCIKGSETNKFNYNFYVHLDLLSHYCYSRMNPQISKGPIFSVEQQQIHFIGLKFIIFRPVNIVKYISCEINTSAFKLYNFQCFRGRLGF